MNCRTCAYNEREYDCVPCQDSYGNCLNYVEYDYFSPVYPDENEYEVSE